MNDFYSESSKDIEKVLISSGELDEICARLAGEIDKDYAASENELLLICVLKGSVAFTVDLMRKIKRPVKIDFIKASSYGSGTVSTRQLKIPHDCGEHDWPKCDVLIIEDIVDSGNTLNKLVGYFKDKGSASVKACALLDKPERREVDYDPDYVGKVIPNEFVVGYGLDVDESYRQLPFIGILKKEVIDKYTL